MPSLLMTLKALPWKLIGLSAAAFFVLALFAHDRIMTAQNGKLKAQLHAQIEAGKQKKSEVREIIKQGKDRIITVEKQVREIESAPTKGDCSTPDAVLNADV